MEIDPGVSIGELLQLVAMAVGLLAGWFNLRNKVDATDTKVTTFAKDTSSQFNEVRAQVRKVESDQHEATQTLVAIKIDVARIEERQKASENTAPIGVGASR